MSININKRNVESLPFTDKGTELYVDTNLEGFGVRVGKKTKSFYVEKRVNGKPKRVTLGRFPVMSVEEARKLALDELSKMAKGIDPAIQKQKEQMAQTQRQMIQRLYAITVAQALADYLAENTQITERTRNDYQKLFRLYLSDWLDMRLIDITETMVIHKHKEATNKAKVSGSQAFRKLRAVFNFAMKYYRIEVADLRSGKISKIPTDTDLRTDTDTGPETNIGIQTNTKTKSNSSQTLNPDEDKRVYPLEQQLMLQQVVSIGSGDGQSPQGSLTLFTHNPVRILTENNAWAKKKRRQTVIHRKKIGVWFQSILEIRDHSPFEMQRTSADYLLVLLLTGMRRDECVKMRWEMVDFELKTIHLPDTQTKAKREHIIPMSDYLCDLLEKRFIQRSSEFVFPSTKSKTGYLGCPRQVMKMVAERTGIQFCRHDLRRTFSSIAEYLGIHPVKIKRLLNHSLSGDVTFDYIITAFDDDGLREPMQKITDFVLEATRNG
jgi:hypothetical protein